ncbi:MAG: ribosome-associated translation inhibitor RaiA [Gammaproteobacteria bacterium]|nr:ribosome-associated translation inhibitor RaiA [Gammaproteobacteria bacterium]
MSASEALRANIETHAQKLERFSGNILGCHVVVEPAGRHHHKGNAYQVHIQVSVPGRDIQVSRDAYAQRRSSEDPYVVIRDMFDAARRQLEDYERKRRGDVKRHTLLQGTEGTAEESSE